MIEKPSRGVDTRGEQWPHIGIYKVRPCPRCSSFQLLLLFVLSQGHLFLSHNMALGKNSAPPEASEHPPRLNSEASNPDAEQEDQQDGVRVAEAVTSSWSKNSLIIAYAS